MTLSTSKVPRIILLDGGMGTTLEKLSYDISSPLWGLEILQNNPAAIRDIHSRFLDSGADFIETATYQLTPELLNRHLGTSSAESTGILRRAVAVADEARQTTSQIGDRRGGGRGIALSFGPFGSTLQPGQEYAGIYPPPYGPSSSQNPPSSSSSKSINYFELTEAEEEERAIDELAKHHLTKLRVFASDEETWRNVDWIAFETVPVLHEVRGIRKAMSLLHLDLRGRYHSSEGLVQENNVGGKEWWKKKFWITSPFPSPTGYHPQQLAEGGHATISLVLKALLLGEGERPNGIGINCTHPRYLSTLTTEYTSAIQRLIQSHPSLKETRPTFVLYPDGGQTYDVHTRTWSSTDGPKSAQEWATGIHDIAQRLEWAKGEDGEQVWDQVIVGGCCKTSFEEITALREEIDKHQTQQ